MGIRDGKYYIARCLTTLPAGNGRPTRSRAWIGGLLDRSGRFVARSGTGRVALTVSARDPWVLHAVRDIYGAGSIDSHDRIEGLHICRVNKPDDIRRILADVLPFLATKTEAAQAALARIDEVLEQRAKRAQRNRMIFVLRDEGRTHAEIAEAVGVSQAVIARVIAQWR